MVITAQQEAGLKAFRAGQEKRDNLRDCDFLDYYVMWQAEQGYYDDAYLIASPSV